MLIFCVIVSCTFALFGLVNGQESSKPILLDEFDSIDCENLLGRQDAFFAELSRNPSDIGYAIIYANEKRSEAYVRRLRAHLFIRQFDRTRVRIVLAKPKVESPVSGAFWRVPPGAAPPPYEEIELKASDVTRPFVYATNFSENVCPSFSADLFAQLILDNPRSRARVVIFGSKSSWRQSTANEELELMTQSTKLPKDRIEFYFVHRPGMFHTMTEYWYIPGRKK
jgi:hypothetical protein